VVTAQTLAAEAVSRVLAGRSLTPTLEGLLARHPGLPAGERGALWDLSYGTLRHLGLLEGVLDQMLLKPVTDAGLRSLLAVAVYQMHFTRAPAYAIVSQAVDACVAQGWPWAKGMVNAILRRFQREQAALITGARATLRGQYSYPEWWIKRIQADHPQQWEAVLAGGNTRPSMGLRVNLRRTTVENYMEQLNAEGLSARSCDDAAVILDRVLPVARLPGFAEGLVSVQDAGAQMAARFLDLHAGQRVLDACAAPGGKSAHILERADVELTALDNDPARLVRIHQNLQRLGLVAQVRCVDATQADTWGEERGFDRVLADVPCTASGVVRRHPDIKWLRREGDVCKLRSEAATILDSLWRVLVPGGKLLFVTCSVFQEENRAQIDDFVGRHADARIEPLPGIDGRDLQLLPDESHDGFYYALVERQR